MHPCQLPADDTTTMLVPALHVLRKRGGDSLNSYPAEPIRNELVRYGRHLPHSLSLSHFPKMETAEANNILLLWKRRRERENYSGINTSWHSFTEPEKERVRAIML